MGPWREMLLNHGYEATEVHLGGSEEDQVAEARLPALHGNGTEACRDRHGVAERCRISVQRLAHPGGQATARTAA